MILGITLQDAPGSHLQPNSYSPRISQLHGPVDMAVGLAYCTGNTVGFDEGNGVTCGEQHARRSGDERTQIESSSFLPNYLLHFLTGFPHDS
ncbi:unnamed protein product, partial [Clonostachys byssicola]